MLALADSRVLAKLSLNVTLLLSRVKRQEQRDTAMKAIPLHQQFFMLAPQVQLYALPLFIQAFKGLDYDHADTFFPKREEIEASIQAMAQAPAAEVAPAAAANRLASEPLFTNIGREEFQKIYRNR